MNVIAILLLCISIVFLSACEPETSNKNTIPSIDYQRIVAGFSYQQPAPIKEKEETVAAENYLKLSLTYPDPLKITPATTVIDGSNTLFPVTQIMIDEFYDEGYAGLFRMNQSSTGAALASMCKQSGIDIVNATRKMEAEEKSICKQHDVVPITIQIGFDPFVLITHPDNTWMTDISQERLPSIFTSTAWSVIDPEYPEEEIRFFLPEKYGDTMNAMTELVYGYQDEPYIRFARNASFYPYNLELTQDLSEDTYGIGFASFGKLQKIQQLNLRILPVDNMHPIRSGPDYPIKRSLYLITTRKALRKPEVHSFIAHYLNRSYAIMPTQGFSPLNGMEGRYTRYNYIEAVKSVQDGDEEPVQVTR